MLAKWGTKVCSIRGIDVGLHSAAEVFDDATQCLELVHGGRPYGGQWLSYVKD